MLAFFLIFVVCRRRSDESMLELSVKGLVVLR